jgi:5-methylcytosine-specific restriction endonuclease McrA
MSRRNGEVDAPTRARVLERDGHHCRWCGTTVGVEVHHILYRSGGGAGEDRNLITLCRVHHDHVHSDKRRWKPILERVIAAFYDEGRSITVLQAARWRS